MQYDRQIKGLDRTDWGDGPWGSEPDLAEWRDPETGLPCLALRHPRDGCWCGYIAIPNGHPWTAEDWDRYSVKVHGEITYGPGPCQSEREDDEHPWHRVCHTPRPGESDDVRWVGFDCGWQGYHNPDYEPGDKYNPEGATYRTLSYVREQCALLAKQAQEASRGSQG